MCSKVLNVMCSSVKNESIHVKCFKKNCYIDVKFKAYASYVTITMEKD